MKKLFIFLFCILIYITTEAQEKNFNARKPNTEILNKTEQSSIKEQKLVSAEATAILLTEINNTSNVEKQAVIINNNSKGNTTTRSSLFIDAMATTTVPTEENVRTPIYSEGIKEENQSSEMRHVSTTAIAVPVQK